MLASNPVQALNQTAADLGIPNRFNEGSSRSRQFESDVGKHL
jgi:hypothetical protein